MFRVSEDEYKEIEERSKRFKFRSVSEYVRFTALTTDNISVQKEINYDLDTPLINWDANLILDLQHSSTDIHHFLSKCSYLHPTYGKTLIDLRPYQKDWIAKYNKHSLIALQNTRQCGTSLITCAYILHKALYSASPKQYLIVTPNIKQGEHSLNTIKQIYGWLPNHLKTGILGITQSSIKFLNGSTISHINAKTASKEDFGRGALYDCVFADMFSWCLDGEAVYTNLSKCCSTLIIGGSASSEPINDNDFFPEICKLAYFSDEATTCNTPWDVVPSRDQNWKEDIIKQIGLENFEREYGSMFN
jgi:hypothetical protein